MSLLTRLLHTFPQALPVGPVVVACRPVLATPADQDAIRRVVTAAFAPSRVLLIDTVRAAAIGCGAGAGVLLIADVGAQLTEVAVLVDGRVGSGPPRRDGHQRPDAGWRATPARRRCHPARRRYRGNPRMRRLTQRRWPADWSSSVTARPGRS